MVINLCNIYNIYQTNVNVYASKCQLHSLYIVKQVKYEIVSKHYI